MYENIQKLKLNLDVPKIILKNFSNSHNKIKDIEKPKEIRKAHYAG